MKKKEDKKWDLHVEKYAQDIDEAIIDIYEAIGKSKNKYGILVVYEDCILSNIIEKREAMSIITPNADLQLIKVFAIHNTKDPIDNLVGAILYLIYEQKEYLNKCKLN